MKWFVYVMVLLTVSNAVMGDLIAGEVCHDRFDWLGASVWVAASVIMQKLDDMVGGRYD